MSSSEEEIQKYLNILQSYEDTFNNTYLISQDTIPLKTPEKVSCHNFNNTHFINHNGYRYCNKCFHSIGHILAYNEITESDRGCFHQKSIYKRDYRYQNSSGNNMLSGSIFSNSPIQNPCHFFCHFVPPSFPSISCHFLSSHSSTNPF